MKWLPHKIGEVVYDLTHLHPFEFEFINPAKDGKPEQSYVFDVVFGLHCFTRSIKDGERFAAELAYKDSRETRLFDVGRYELSRRLPAIVREIHARRCFHTNHGNFFTVEIVQDDGSSAEYAVYFTVSRSGGGRLKFFVQSAYIQRDVPRTRPRPRKPIRFSVIAFNVKANKPIKAPQ